MKVRVAFLGFGVVAIAFSAPSSIAQEVQTTAVSRAQLSVPSEFRHASEFVRLLEQAGVPVQEVLQSHLDGTFKGARTAVFVRTALGVVEIVVLPGATDAEQVSITYTRNASTVVPHHYTLKGPLLGIEGRPMDAAYPFYFTLHRNWFIMTGEPRLDDVLKRALKQTNRPVV